MHASISEKYSYRLNAPVIQSWYAPSESIVVMNMMPGQDTSFDEEFKFDSPKSGGVTFSTQNYENKRVLAKVQQQDEAAYALITTPIRAELDALTKLVKSQAGMACRRSERRIWVLRGVLGHDLNMAVGPPSATTLFRNCY